MFSADKESPSVDDTGEALLSSFSNSVTSKSSRLRSSSALSTTDSTVSAAGQNGGALADTEERFDEAELEMENGCLVPTMFWNEWEKITKLKLSQQDNKEGSLDLSGGQRCPPFDQLARCVDFTPLAKMTKTDSA